MLTVYKVFIALLDGLGSNNKSFSPNSPMVRNLTLHNLLCYVFAKQQTIWEEREKEREGFLGNEREREGTRERGRKSLLV